MTPLLAGLRIVDITTILLGPFATQILADMGADVIKIEAPDGDQNRWNPPHGEPGIGAGFAGNNRNKRSLALDLKSEEGKGVLRRLTNPSQVMGNTLQVPPPRLTRGRPQQTGSGYIATE